MDLSTLWPDKLGQRATLAQRFLAAVNAGDKLTAMAVEHDLIAQLRHTGHLSTDDKNIGAHIEWGCVEHDTVHVCYGNVPQEGQHFDDAWFADKANDDHWLEVNPTTGEVTNL